MKDCQEGLRDVVRITRKGHRFHNKEAVIIQKTEKTYYLRLAEWKPIEERINYGQDATVLSTTPPWEFFRVHKSSTELTGEKGKSWANSWQEETADLLEKLQKDGVSKGKIEAWLTKNLSPSQYRERLIKYYACQ